MVKISSAVLALLILIIAFPTSTLAAQTRACDNIQGIDWQSSSTKTFIILYPQEFSPIGQILTARGLGRALDDEYNRFSALYQTSLPTPVSIRIYPDVRTYSCLNSPTNEIGDETIHSHSGGREIALIGDNIQRNFAVWAAHDINLVRYELSLLFARQVSGDRLPPGLSEAIGRYSQDPAQTLGLLELSWSDWQEPTYTWRSLWDGGPEDLARQVEAASTVAFLVDRFGWTNFLSFIQSLSSSRSYSHSLEQIYRTEASNLEQQWQAYYPVYFRGRWKTHPVYNYDLSQFQQQIRSEQYLEADKGLQSALEFLQKMEDTDRILYAQRLQIQAKKGQEAEYMFAQSRQAYEGGRYAESLAWLTRSEQLYAEVGTRIYHLDEFSAYRQQVHETLALHVELDRLEADAAASWNTFWLGRRITRLAERLYSLGDIFGHQRAARLATLINSRRQAQYLLFATGVIVLALVLLVVRVWLARRMPPVEAQL